MDDKPFKVGKFERILLKVAPSWGLSRIQAQYHAFRYDAARYSSLRGHSAGAFQQNPNATQYQSDRIRMMYEARDMAENVPLAASILLKLSDYTVGRVQYQARTGNLDRDKKYNRFMQDRADLADFSGRSDLIGLMGLGVMGMFKDGESGYAMVEGEDGYAQLQGIECDRIGNPYRLGATVDPHNVHGVLINDNGQVVGYEIWQRGLNNQYFNPQPVEAENFLHLYDPKRFDEYHGVTGFHAVLNTLRDVAEIVGFEKTSVKWASSITGLIVKQTGRANKMDGDFFDKALTGGTVFDALSAMEPGQLKYLNPDEDIRTLVNQRPTPAWQGFIQLLIRDIALGCNMPYGFIYDASGLNGNVARLESMQAQRAFSRVQLAVIRKVLNPLRDEWLSTAILKGDLPPCPDWRNGKWLFTAHPTMDVGRESAANLAENRQGLKTAADIYAEQGKDVFEEHEQLAVEAANIVALAKQYDVPVAMIQTLATNGRTDADPQAVATDQGIAQQVANKPVTKQLSRGRWVDSGELEETLAHALEANQSVTAHDLEVMAAEELRHLDPDSPEAAYLLERYANV